MLFLKESILIFIVVCCGGVAALNYCCVIKDNTQENVYVDV